MCETRRRGAARLGREKKKKGLRRGGRRVCVRCAGGIRKNKHSHKGEEGGEIKIRPTGVRTVLGIRDSVYLIY